jgi:hypothetical protein
MRFSVKSSQKSLRVGRDKCHGANLADQNAVYDRLEIFQAAMVPKYN